MPSSGCPSEQRWWEQQDRAVFVGVKDQLDAHVGRWIAPDFEDPAVDWFPEAPGHEDVIPDPDVPLFAGHHGFLPKTLCR